MTGTRDRPVGRQTALGTGIPPLGSCRALAGGSSCALDQLVHALNPILRGWTNYHRHAASKRCFSYLDHYLWWRVMRWLRKKHPRLTWKQIKRRYWGRSWTSPDGTRLYWPGQVSVTRYRYRGHRIPTPWATPDTTRATTRAGAGPAGPAP